MKRIFLTFFLAVLCTANSFAASDNNISRIIPAKNTANTANTNVSDDSENNNSIAARIASRRVNKNSNTNSEANNNKNISRTISRSVVKDNTARTQTKSNATVVSRSQKNQKSEREILEATVNTVGRNARVSAASINNTAAVRRAGVVLRASTAEVGGRATIGDTGVQTGSNIDEQVRAVHSRAGIFGGSTTKKQITPTAESIAEAKDILEKTADLNCACQAQYNECMDQFCAVVDANQKRCSCSANLARYAKAQKAVEDANVELNDVAQRIRYVGLSADEIRAIMSETEAEQAMSKNRDNTKTRSMLEDIADMIEKPTSSVSSFMNDSNSGTSLLDMDFDFSSDSSDLSMDLFGGTKSSDISSKRGKDLYNEATKRCKSILTACEDAGGTAAQISGNYDLAIDKDCVAYEQGLEKLNETLVNNVRSANLMLQKARLAVLQNKNQYDIKGCVAALENCMLDDMVCGDDYIKCVDPTKVYIDENGEVVLGRNIANITNFMTEYNNTKIDAKFIENSKGDTTCQNHDGACIVNYLMTKIGTGATAKDGGLCRAVLDKCQDRTYVQNGKTFTYNPYNDVIVNYIQRAMVNIKSAQTRIISDYASNCMQDVQECYNSQSSQIASWSSSATVDNIYKVLTGTCYNVALTCGYAVFAYDWDMQEQLSNVGYSSNPEANEAKKQEILIYGISEAFYQSLLCPINSTFVVNSDKTDADVNRTIEGYVNNRCKCNIGYSVWNGACLSSCADRSNGNPVFRNSAGKCEECSESGGVTGGGEGIEPDMCGGVAESPAHNPSGD